MLMLMLPLPRQKNCVLRSFLALGTARLKVGLPLPSLPTLPRPLFPDLELTELTLLHLPDGRFLPPCATPSPLGGSLSPTNSLRREPRIGQSWQPPPGAASDIMRPV